MTTFYLDAVYWGGWASISPSVNVSNLSYRDIILTGFGSFLGFPWRRLIDIMGTKSNDISNDYIKTAGVGGMCTNYDGAVECLGMHSQSFWNLELGSTRLEIQVKAGYIKSTYISSVSIVKCSEINLQSFWNQEMGDTEIEIQVKTYYICKNNDGSFLRLIAAVFMQQ